MLLTIIAFVLVIGILVFVHELGHFSVAKIFGVKVEEFGMGFPPRLFKIKKGETIYSINAIPFGGFVKLLGQDGESHSKDSFMSKRSRVKIPIIAAGVIMNFLLAGVLFSIGYGIGMPPVRLNPDNLPGKKTNMVMFASILDDSVAKGAGLKVGDQVIGFNSAEEFTAFTSANKGTTVELKIKSENGAEQTKTVNLGAGDYPLGVGLVDLPSVKMGFFNSIYYGFKELIFTTYFVLQMLLVFLGQLFSTFSISKDVAGPVGIFNITGQAVKYGLVYVLQLAAILSINLGLVNFLPFPALDGGKAFLIFLQGIFKKKIIRAEVENILSLVGFALIILLISTISIREIIGLL